MNDLNMLLSCFRKKMPDRTRPHAPFPFFLFQAQNQASSSGGLSDQEKREKKALEKKLLEMEEELRVRNLRSVTNCIGTREGRQNGSIF